MFLKADNKSYFLHNNSHLLEGYFIESLLLLNQRHNMSSHPFAVEGSLTVSVKVIHSFHSHHYMGDDVAWSWPPLYG